MTKKKAKKPTKKLVRLNLGCGTALLPEKDGWINVDNFNLYHKDKKNFVKADIRQLPFEKDFADYVLLDNVLEHFAMADVPVVLNEVRRVLKPGGQVVIFVPDMSDIMAMWAELLQQSWNPLNYVWVQELIYGNQYNEGEFHRCAMYPYYLNYAMNMAGFRGFKVISYPRSGKCPTEYAGIQQDPNSVLRCAMLLVDANK